MKNKPLSFLLEHLPSEPGVYLMQDAHGRIIYIGKAKDLKNRVSQYFSRPQLPKVAAMVRRIAKFETIVTNSEKEAFILELKLIQTHYPRYNIMLKDDSHYPYIALTKKGDPVVTIKRKTNDDKYIYFGPFPASQKAYQIVDLINKIFMTRKCKSKSKEPCFYYHLGQCPRYCFKDIDEETKDKIRDDILTFLNGRDKEMLKRYETKMKLASDALDFEKARDYKAIVDAILHIYSSQNIELKNKIDLDVFAFSQINDYIGLNIVSYRAGILLNEQFNAFPLFNDLNEQIINIIGQYYKKHPLPSKLMLGNSYVANALASFYDKEVIVPTRGQNLAILNRAYQNATAALQKHLLYHQALTSDNDSVTALSKLLGINYPTHIDFVDIAHLFGSEALGVVVTYINGRPFKKLYRKYNIESSNTFDDYGSINEVLTRHYKRKLSEGKHIPDLLIVDGGKGQLNVALAVINALELKFSVISLVKDDKHTTRALVNDKGEEIAIPNTLLTFLAAIQNEGHRYAISSHRAKRGKGTYTSALDGIKGLGKKRKMVLLNTYKSIDVLKTVPLTELSQLIPREVAVALLAKLNNTNNDNREGAN
ncbi:MAG: UvrABC system protein C [Tenericutes bacterium ADurb.Bin087]|nr:MAG: UvrABC system protein C [Tenericutes bacterium ADurb.Bin087]